MLDILFRAKNKETGDWEYGFLFQMHRKEDIDLLMSNFNVERLHFIGTDMISHYFRDKINEMSDDVYSRYLDYHMYICERADMIGVSNHFLDVFRKL